MKLTKNIIFDELILKWEIPLDIFNIPIVLPKIIQDYINTDIIKNEYWIGLRGYYFPCKDPEWYDQDYFEDSENHFHIDSQEFWLSEKEYFQLSIMTVRALAKKFQENSNSKVVIWMNFETAEMSKIWAIQNWLHTIWDEYYLNSRISFYIKRENWLLRFSKNPHEEHSAILAIEI